MFDQQHANNVKNRDSANANRGTQTDKPEAVVVSPENGPGSRTFSDHPDARTIQRWQSTIGNRRTVQRIQQMRAQRVDEPNTSANGGAGNQSVLPEPGSFQVTLDQLRTYATQSIPSNVAIVGATGGAEADPHSGGLVQADGTDDGPVTATRDPYTIQITAAIPSLGLPQWRTHRLGDFSLLQQPGLQLSVNLDPTRGLVVPQSYAAYLAITALTWHIQRNWVDLTLSLGQLGIGPDSATGWSGQAGGQASLALRRHTTLNVTGALTVAPDARGNLGVTPNPLTVTFGGVF